MNASKIGVLHVSFELPQGMDSRNGMVCGKPQLGGDAQQSFVLLGSSEVGVPWGGGANTFKVHLASGIIRVYKVYYYVARPDIKKENRRWMNIALVRALYPGDVKVHADTNDLPDLFLPIHP